MKSKKFEDVRVWRKAHQFVLDVYAYSRLLPKEELFGLSSQLQRAAASVPANFAEGFKKTSRREKARMYNIAQASLEECRYYLILAEDLGYERPARLKSQLEEVSRMLEHYMRSMLEAERK